MATLEERIDPALAPGLEVYRMLGFEDPGLSLDAIPAMRATLTAIMEGAAAEIPPNERVETRVVEAVDADGGSMELRVHRPVDAEGPLPALYWIHGGGMIIGFAAMDDPSCQAFAEQVGCVVVSPEYRLAPEHPHPTPVEDCYAGLQWAAEHADELGIDADRLAVGGGSAGGGLAAGTVLLARDRGGPSVAFQLLIYPMIDDRNVSSSAAEFDDIVSWGRRHNRMGWEALLGDAAGGDDVSPYAAPARAEDLSGLPPAFVAVGDLETFRDEDIEYAARLLQAGVPTELHVYPGVYHAAEVFAPEAETSGRIVRDRTDALRRALHPAD